MIPILRNPISRRALLRGLGVSLPLPFLEAMLPRAVHAAPSKLRPPVKAGAVPTPRGIFCFVPDGGKILAVSLTHLTPSA